MLSILAIVLVSILSLHKVLRFYFWHDDFSILYTARTGECVFGWPYSSYCTLFPFLDKFFNYSAFWYFFLGFLLGICSFVAFYFLAREFFPKKASLLITLLFSTAYLGAGAFLEAYSIITTFLSLATLFLSLLVFKKFKNLYLGFLFLFFSTITLEARSATYALLVVTLIFVFQNKLKPAKRILLSIAVSAFHFFFYMFGYFVKFGGSGQPLAFNNNWILSLDPIRKISLFLQNISFMILPDGFYSTFHIKIGEQAMDLTYLLTGILIIGIFLMAIFKEKNKAMKRIRIFSILFTVFLYLPYGIVSDTRLDGSHRYLAFVFPGLLFMLATFHKNKVWTIVVTVLIILGFLQANSYFGLNLERSRLRREFFEQLHILVPRIKSGDAFLFDAPKEVKATMGDFFRVGHEPSEASIGTEFGIKHSEIKIIEGRKELEAVLKSGLITRDNLYSFYYDGKELLRINLFR